MTDSDNAGTLISCSGVQTAGGGNGVCLVETTEWVGEGGGELGSTSEESVCC